jgi:hypothetical protein
MRPNSLLVDLMLAGVVFFRLREAAWKMGETEFGFLKGVRRP